jgi:hypothetical protein
MRMPPPEVSEGAFALYGARLCLLAHPLYSNSPDPQLATHGLLTAPRGSSGLPSDGNDG